MRSLLFNALLKGPAVVEAPKPSEAMLAELATSLGKRARERLGRSLSELIGTLEILKGRHIALLSLEERSDTGSAAGELMLHVFGAMAHFERRLIAERTKDGIAAARLKGKHPGRRLVDRDKVAAAVKLVEAGLSPTAAAREVGLGRATVYREMAHSGVRRPA